MAAEWFDVRDYGAVGNGTTDDSQAFLNAQAAASPTNAWVFVSPGTYLLANPPSAYSSPFFFAAGGEVLSVAGKSFAFNGPIEAPIAKIFGGSGEITLGSNTTVRPEWWGAAGDGSTDDSAAIQSAIDALVAGGKVEFRGRTYAISQYLRVTSSHVTLCGIGKDATQLQVISPADTGIAITGSTVKQSFTQISYCCVRDLTIVRPPAASGVGIELYYTAVARIENVKISGFLNGVTLQRATNTQVSSTEVEFNPTSSISNFVGFSIDGSPAGFSTTSTNATSPGANTVFDVSTNPTNEIEVGDSIVVDLNGANEETCAVTAVTSASITVSNTLYSHASGITIIDYFGGSSDKHGNVSSVFRDCWVDASPGVGGATPDSIGVKVFASRAGNADCGDLLFDAPQVASAAYGMSFDFSNAMTYADANADIEIINPVLDYWWIHGIYINGPGAVDVTSAISISGGWISANPNNEKAQYDAMYISNMRGVSISGVQFFPAVTAYEAGQYNFAGITATSSQNIAVRGSLFNGQNMGIYFTACSFCSVVGNSFFSSPKNGVGREMSPAVSAVNGSTGIVISSNNFDAAYSGGMTSSILIDATSAGCVVVGNTLSSNISTANPQVNGSNCVDQFNVVT